MILFNDFCEPPRNQRVLFFNPSLAWEYNVSVTDWIRDELNCETFSTPATSLDNVKDLNKYNLDCAIDLSRACFRKPVDPPVCPFTGKQTVPVNISGPWGYYNMCQESKTLVLADRQFLDFGIYDDDYGDRISTKINPRYALLAGDIFRDCKLPANGSLLDIGFANTAIMVAFARKGWKVTGIDLACSPVRRKQIKAVGGKFIKSDISKNEIKGTYDIVWVSHVIEHLTNPAETIERICGAVAPGGYLFVSAPDSEPWFDKGDQTGISVHLHPEQHVWIGPSSHVANICRNNGFTILKDEKYGDPFPGAFEFVTINEWRLLAQKV